MIRFVKLESAPRRVVWHGQEHLLAACDDGNSGRDRCSIHAGRAHFPNNRASHLRASDRRKSRDRGWRGRFILRVPRSITRANGLQVATIARWWTNSSHRRQTVDALIAAFHRVAADGYENFATSNRPNCQAALSNKRPSRSAIVADLRL